jgi:hypothetical protein
VSEKRTPRTILVSLGDMTEVNQLVHVVETNHTFGFEKPQWHQFREVIKEADHGARETEASDTECVDRKENLKLSPQVPQTQKIFCAVLSSQGENTALDREAQAHIQTAGILQGEIESLQYDLTEARETVTKQQELIRDLMDALEFYAKCFHSDGEGGLHISDCDTRPRFVTMNVPACLAQSKNLIKEVERLQREVERVPGLTARRALDRARLTLRGEADTERSDVKKEDKGK